MSTRRLAVFVAVALAPVASAWAQGYTVAEATGRIEPRPPSATSVEVTSADPARASASVPLPFTFWYYGTPCKTAVVSAHGWILPGATKGFERADDPSAPHGQDSATASFPYGGLDGASANGIVAPLWTTFTAVNDGSPAAGTVSTWTVGTAPRRRFVISWHRVAAGPAGRVTVQTQLQEGTGTIVFAYATDPITGAAAAPQRFVCGLDAPGDARFTAPLASVASAVPGAQPAVPPCDFVLTPRTPLFNAPDAPEVGEPVTWRRVRLESLRGADGANSATYVAKGSGWFFVPDRAVRTDRKRLAELTAEDRATFAGPVAGDAAKGGPAKIDTAKGDPERFIRQVLDGKVVLLPNNDGAPVRLWFRVVECFSIDDRGLSGRDDHLWNIRLLLAMTFPEGDPRRDIENYCAWRGMASSRLAVVKVFDVAQTNDAGRQFDTGRATEDVLWCARIKAGTRGPLPPNDCPVEGWTRFPMDDHGVLEVHHADKRDIRIVPDPNYVESGYEYVVTSDTAPRGWILRRRTPPAAMTDEPFEFDPTTKGPR